MEIEIICKCGSPMVLVRDESVQPVLHLFCENERCSNYETEKFGGDTVSECVLAALSGMEGMTAMELT